MITIITRGGKKRDSRMERPSLSVVPGSKLAVPVIKVPVPIWFLKCQFRYGSGYPPGVVPLLAFQVTSVPEAGSDPSQTSSGSSPGITK